MGIDEVDDIISGVSDDDLAERIASLSPKSMGRLRNYLQGMIDDGEQSHPDRMVKKALIGMKRRDRD